MKKISQFLRAPRPAGTMLIIGVFAGITIGGGVGVVASSSSKPVTVCVNKANFMRYSKTNKCAAGETRVAIGQTGAAGAKGDTGSTGSTGAKGDTGAAGAKGDTGAAGAKGDTGSTGAAGVKGDTGAAGAKGDTGDRGTNGTNGINATAITPQSVCDGSDANTVADEVCKVGMTGPGGGLIFFVDYNDEYATYDYLEAAPTDGVFAFTSTGGTSRGMWSATTLQCGVLLNANCQTNHLNGDYANALVNVTNPYIGIFGGKAATAAIVARHDAGSVVKDTYAAGVADAYESNGKTDWWLPSPAEIREMQEKLNGNGNGGVGGFSGQFHYWTSYQTSSNYAHRLAFSFVSYYQNDAQKSQQLYVRPVRGF
jgi:hypothetical protein